MFDMQFLSVLTCLTTGGPTEKGNPGLDACYLRALLPVNSTLLMDQTELKILVEQIASFGDEKAFRQLFLYYYDRLFYWSQK